MAQSHPIADWLERHWVSPAYAGSLLTGIALSFFGAATNTLAGWLYVISGLILAMLVISAILPVRSLRGIKIHRYPIEPVSVGDPLIVELEISNHTNQPKTLLQLQDLIPQKLGAPAQTVLERIPARDRALWSYRYPTERRGVYRWHEVQLRTATPLGLFWCRRSRQVPAVAIVYPTVLPLSRCPLIDAMGRDENPQFSSNHRSHMATEGLTRALRPYRWGDPTRLIHWRSSARYGTLRVRELEIFTGGQEIIICLDSAASWDHAQFEQAVIAAASLYFYALRQAMLVKLWTAGSGLLHSETTLATNGGRTSWQSSQAALETLASTYAGEDLVTEPPTDVPLLWLTTNAASLEALPTGSRWLLWPGASQAATMLDLSPSSVGHPGLVIQPTETLLTQLQVNPDKVLV
ncbi:MAG: DUF58 domain-containing protein [Cyanobacteria bacterium]|nr:DUF58 domain-containing protein [Cyanobacteriota bacterium]MDW8199663.1 DUF58 domain-containing protein [Cyanobacteriota bacterium SKYGB_h_bin112]